MILIPDITEIFAKVQKSCQFQKPETPINGNKINKFILLYRSVVSALKFIPLDSDVIYLF